MAVDDWLDSEVAIAVAATTVALSPRARRVARKGAVYAVAGALKAADLASAAARGVTEGVGSAGGPRDEATPDAGERPAPKASPA